jgi:alkylation response protein AidB-like acyl-CoA dehydrogenase
MNATPQVQSRPLSVEEVTENARGIVPVLWDQAREGELMNQATPDVIEAAAEARLFETMVPKRFGGHGLGCDALAHITRVLAYGDPGASWAIGFLIEHNWMACHLPMETQEELFADRNYILAGAPLGLPYGKAERVDGGFLITSPPNGWPYGSGLANGDWNFVGALVDTPDGPDESEPYAFVVRKEDLDVIEGSWRFSGMATTGSLSSKAERLFVPERYASPYSEFLSADNHPGVVHEEPVFRTAGKFAGMVAGLSLGAAERAVDLGLERLETTRIFGTPRIDQSLSRARWANARQVVRASQLMFDSIVEGIATGGEGKPAEKDAAQEWLDVLWVVRTCTDAVRAIVDGAGSSALALSHPLQRLLRDSTVMANHVTTDWDWAIDNGARRLLGLPGDDLLRPGRKVQPDAVR